ncbi:MAG: glutaredoxin family protein [Pseudomonadota bacterium]
MLALRLYGGKNCHLCDVAQELLHQVDIELRQQGNMGMSVEYVDVRQDKGLLIQYGRRIPVLVCSESGDDVQKPPLDWPFDRDAILTWLD